MKKGKKNTVYLLIPLVTIIWGVIIYKIFFLGNPVIEEGNTSTFQLSGIEKDTLNAMKFELVQNYDDPFLGRKKMVKSVPKSVKSKSIVKTAPPKWPDVRFNGCVSNEDAMLAYLSIRGTTYLAVKGEKLDDIEILELRNDSILLSYKNKSKWLKK